VTTALIVAPWDGEVVEAKYIADTAITGAATNNRKLQVLNKGADATGTNVAAEIQFESGTDAAAWVPVDLTLDTTDATSDGIYEKRRFSEGDVLCWHSAAVGTGIADPGGTAVVTLQRVNADDMLPS
jgi:hypothetical protein